jgi:hypothetical protein
MFSDLDFGVALPSAERMQRASLPAGERNQIAELFDLMADLFEVWAHGSHQCWHDPHSLSLLVDSGPSAS